MHLNEITQRRLEAYQEALVELGEGAKSGASFNRIVVESAVRAGIAEQVPDALLDMTPRAVIALTEKVIAHIKAATAPVSGE